MSSSQSRQTPARGQFAAWTGGPAVGLPGHLTPGVQGQHAVPSHVSMPVVGAAFAPHQAAQAAGPSADELAEKSAPVLLSVEEALHVITKVKTPIEQARLSEGARRAAKVTGIVLALLVFAALAAAVVPVLVTMIDRARAGEMNRLPPPAPGGQPGIGKGNGWHR